MRFPDMTDLRFLTRTLIIGLAIYICLDNLLEGRRWQIGPGACMQDSKYYSLGAIVDMGYGPMQCIADPEDEDAPAIWAGLP
jgi:hypothetical protein